MWTTGLTATESFARPYCTADRSVPIDRTLCESGLSSASSPPDEDRTTSGTEPPLTLELTPAPEESTPPTQAISCLSRTEPELSETLLPPSSQESTEAYSELSAERTPFLTREQSTVTGSRSGGAAVALDHTLEHAFQRDVRIHFFTGDELELVDDFLLAWIGHRDEETVVAHQHRKDQMLFGDLARQ